jgi:magnesium chelatase family protein
MVQIIKTFTNLGLIGHEIHIEADSSKALPTIEIIGLADIMIKEAKERIRATFRNCNIRLPNLKFILNLAPSDIRKVGTGFDVPMALALFLLTQEGVFQHKDNIEN